MRLVTHFTASEILDEHFRWKMQTTTIKNQYRVKVTTTTKRTVVNGDEASALVETDTKSTEPELIGSQKITVGFQVCAEFVLSLIRVGVRVLAVLQRRTADPDSAVCTQNEVIIMDPLDQIPWITSETQPTKRRRLSGAGDVGGHSTEHSTEQGHASASSAASGSSADGMLTVAPGKHANCGESAVANPEAEASSAPTFAAGDEVRALNRLLALSIQTCWYQACPLSHPIAGRNSHQT